VGAALTTVFVINDVVTAPRELCSAYRSRYGSVHRAVRNFAEAMAEPAERLRRRAAQNENGYDREEASPNANST
jgi:hypothetical protein